MSIPAHARCFDDFAVGEVFESGDHLVTEDEMRVRAEAPECRASRSKPDRSLVRCRHALVKQHGRTVSTVPGMAMYRRRPA